MKNEEILTLSTEDIVAQIKQEKSNLQKRKFAHAVTPLQNPMAIRHSRRFIARLATELRAREIKAAK
jgi:large subunit ribosomal protein L29